MPIPYKASLEMENILQDSIFYITTALQELKQNSW